MEINFRADQEERLKKLCAEMGRTVDDFAGEAILTFMEDYEDGRDAEAVMSRVRNGEEVLNPLEDVMRRFGLDRGDVSDSTEAARSAGPGSSSANSQIFRPAASRAA